MTFQKQFNRFVFLAFLTAAGTPCLRAEVLTADPPGVTVIPAGFYADGEPISALEVVQRTPGFSYNQGNAQLRGLEGGAGNVLIDGRRPTSKSLTLNDVLQRIPYSTIDHIEIIRAGSNGYDMMGYQVVLNVVRSDTGASTLIGEVTGQAYRDNRRDFGGSGRIEHARNAGAFSSNASLVYKSEQTGNAGEGEYSRSGSSETPAMTGTYDADDWQKSVVANGSGTYAWRGFNTTLNLSASRIVDLIDQASEYHLEDGGTLQEIVDIERDKDTLEGGLNLEGNLAENLVLDVKLLHRSEAQDNNSSLDLGDAEILAHDVFDWTETVSRGLLRWKTDAGITWEFGGEAAFNRLDSLVRVDVDGRPLDLPNSDITVSEDRYEAFARATLKVGENWLLEPGLNYERSTLTQSGDANLVKDFQYPKPRLALSWSVAEDTAIRLRYEKVVGQLSFYSFAASPSLETGLISAGNANLEPQVSREYEVQLEQHFWEKGSAILSYKYEDIENALDFIPIGDNFDALGNAGPATRYSWALDLALPFDTLGWTGATLRTHLEHFDSDIVDPFTGESRNISERIGFTGGFGFTWELPQFHSVLGIDGKLGFDNRAYRAMEIRRDQDIPVPLNIWWDREFDNDLTLRISLWSLNFHRERTREIYPDGRVDAGDPIIETRSARQDPYLMVRLRKTF